MKDDGGYGELPRNLGVQQEVKVEVVVKAVVGKDEDYLGKWTQHGVSGVSGKLLPKTCHFQMK